MIFVMKSFATLLLVALAVTAAVTAATAAPTNTGAGADGGIRRYYLLPAADDAAPGGGGGANLRFTLEARFGTTGRIARLANPSGHWHVACPGCATHGRCDGGDRQSVDVQARRHNCVYASNLGPFSFNKTAQCFGPLVSDGRVVQPIGGPNAGAVCVGLFRAPAKQWFVGHAAAAVPFLDKLEQLACGFTWLVVDGVALTSADREVAPRTALGIDRRGRLVSLVAEGSEVMRIGLVPNATAVWMRDLGARYAVNFDGGGSSTTYYAPNFGVQGVPTNNDTFCFALRDVAAIQCIR